MRTMYKCTRCGEVFEQEDGGLRSELIDSGPGYKHFEQILICPACRWDELDEFEQVSDECAAYDCEGDCDACELMKEIEKKEGGQT